MPPHKRTAYSRATPGAQWHSLDTPYRFKVCQNLSAHGVRSTEVAQKKWNRLKGFALLKLVVNHVKFMDGVQVLDESRKNAANPHLTIAPPVPDALLMANEAVRIDSSSLNESTDTEP